MKTLVYLSVFIFAWMAKAFSQDMLDTNSIRSYFYDLPINSSRETIVKAATERFSNNRITTPIIEANTRIYFEDTTIRYLLFGNWPVKTSFKIFDIWNSNNSNLADTTLYIVMDAYFGVDNKAKKRMYACYNRLISDFSDRFSEQKPYKIVADQVIDEGLNFRFKGDAALPRFGVGWSNGGCFPDYHVSVSYSKIVHH
jgi:hypothetical protein